MTFDALFSPAYAAMAMTFMAELGWATISLEEAIKQTAEWARKAVEIDPNDADGQAILAWTTGVAEGPCPESWDRVSLALSINPSSVWANQAKGAHLLFSGRPAEARHMLSTALRLDPHGPTQGISLTQIAASYYFEGQYLQAQDAAQRAVSRRPGTSSMANRWLSASLGQLGRIDEARDVLQKLVKTSPESIDFYVRNRPPWFRPEDHERVVCGLRKAGWEG
jgi:tetratricopeptide (TPR) repeat protein